jgi:alkylated DNA repair protein (DNA oxidative demethylase)
MDLFEDADAVEPREESLGAGAVLLRGFATADAVALLAAVQEVAPYAPGENRLSPR